MILLDTNVISETQRQEPNARVLEWLDAQALETLYLSAITVAELRAGGALMPVGKRRESQHETLEKRLLPMFANRVLSFDLACTKAYAELLAWLSKPPMPSLPPSLLPMSSQSPPAMRALSWLLG
jgi:toxin FitB